MELSTSGRVGRLKHEGTTGERVILSSRVITIIGVLVAISLASTVIALGLQSYLGRLPYLAVLGQVMAAVAAAVFALKLGSRR